MPQQKYKVIKDFDFCYSRPDAIMLAIMLTKAATDHKKILDSLLDSNSWSNGELGDIKGFRCHKIGAITFAYTGNLSVAYV